MNILKPTTFTWWQLGLLKLSVVLIGIAIGAHFASFFEPYTLKLVIVGAVMGLYVGYVWFKK